MAIVGVVNVLLVNVSVVSVPTIVVVASGNEMVWVLFVFGEASVTRCVVKLPSGELGFSYALGRDKAKAEQAAVIDALLQSGDKYTKNTIFSILKTIEKKHLAEKELRSRKAAATKVNFFTLVRGDG